MRHLFKSLWVQGIILSITLFPVAWSADTGNEPGSSPGSGNDLIFESHFEDPVPLNQFSGTYSIKTRHHLGPEYTRRSDDMSPMQSGDHVDTLLQFFADPPQVMSQQIVDIPELANGLEDPAASAILLDDILSAAIEENNPVLLSSLPVVAADLKELLEHPRLLGELILPTEPDGSQVIADASHRYFALEFSWLFPCADDPNSICDPVVQNLRTLTGDPVLTIASDLDATVEMQAFLNLPAHPIALPYSRLFRDLIETFVIPEFLNRPNITSTDGLVNFWIINAVIELYNGQFQPRIECSGFCTCNDASLAFETLYLDAGGSTADALLIAQFACQQGSINQSASLNNALDGLMVDPISGSWQSLASCPFVDENDDLIADGLGPVCKLDTQLSLLNGEELNALATFASE